MMKKNSCILTHWDSDKIAVIVKQHLINSRSMKLFYYYSIVNIPSNLYINHTLVGDIFFNIGINLEQRLSVLP